MPVATVTRSQSAHPTLPNQVFRKKNIALLPIFFNASMNLVTKKGPAVNELAAALPIPGEQLEPENLTNVQGGGIIYEFTPSHLRTIYRIQSVSIPLPTNLISLSFTGAGVNKELEVQYGWVALLNVGGTNYYSEEFILETTAIAGERFTKSQLKQLQFTQPITAAPGTTLRLELVPFVRILKSKELETFAFTSWVVMGVQVLEATLMYEQEFHEHKGE